MKEAIRRHILALGGDICGFASVDRFAGAPEGFSPVQIWGDCRSVIAFGVALPKGLFQISPRLIYGHYNQLSCVLADEIALRAAKHLEQTYGCKAVPMPCDSPYEHWDEGTMTGRGLLSMKHIGVQAGLGSMGKNSLFACKEYGNRVTLGCILSDLPLASDEIAPNLCMPGCRKCVDACPVSAIEGGTVDQKRCRTHTYGKTARGFDTVDCNACRAVCPLNGR